MFIQYNFHSCTLFDNIDMPEFIILIFIPCMLYCIHYFTFLNNDEINILMHKFTWESYFIFNLKITYIRCSTHCLFLRISLHPGILSYFFYSCTSHIIHTVMSLIRAFTVNLWDLYMSMVKILSCFFFRLKLKLYVIDKTCIFLLNFVLLHIYCSYIQGIVIHSFFILHRINFYKNTHFLCFRFHH